eukprot:3783487-Rhodomonas_salina.2
MIPQLTLFFIEVQASSAVTCALAARDSRVTLPTVRGHALVAAWRARSRPGAGGRCHGVKG